MVHRAPVRPGSGTGDSGAASRNVPRVSTAAKARQLLSSAGLGNADEAEVQQLAAPKRLREVGYEEARFLAPHKPSRSAVESGGASHASAAPRHFCDGA